jgi:hypothetical protein
MVELMRWVNAVSTAFALLIALAPKTAKSDNLIN